ncbi:hypothetical protein GCM10025867_25700 [Frondihabitans sucicola]|uniref:Uncharacterized protein n=1 Tax=Frondihabitans sucicola TaxID=1268041 RepID=A0ABM8GPH0_9MICO|nr:hypothetical protein [Frondihabitans sucicola]BDZ50329.1 hypothetical protein GCM10025867_25700 [Frondihabitans sucicola]
MLEPPRRQGLILEADGTRVTVAVPPALQGDFRELRAIMAAPETGTWLSTELVMQRDGGFEWDFNNDRRVYFGEPDPFIPPPEGCEIVPADWVWTSELARFPRSGASVAAWMTELDEPDYSGRLPERLVTILKTFDALQPVAGTFFHGLSVPIRPTEPFFSRGIVPLSRDIRIATENFSVPQLAVVACLTGRDIEPASQYPEEHEVVMRPNTWYRPVGSRHLDQPDLDLIVLDELVRGRAPRTWTTQQVDDLVDSTARVAEAASRIEEVEITTPGKFVDEIS